MNSILHLSSLLLFFAMPSYRLKFSSWWGPKSAQVAADSSFALLKSNLLDKLLEMGFIAKKDMDRRNRTPHVELRRSENDRGGADWYNRLNGLLLTITVHDINWNRDWIDIDVGGGKHLTLVYSKGIGSKRSDIEPVLHYILPLYAEGVAEEEKAVAPHCHVCLDKAKDIVLKPCSHFCVCGECAGKLTACPVCRVEIRKREKIYDC